MCRNSLKGAGSSTRDTATHAPFTGERRGRGQEGKSCVVVGVRDVFIAIEARCSVTETVDRGDRRSQLRRRPRCRGLGPRRGREARRGRTRLRRKRERNKSSNPPAGIFRLARKLPVHFRLFVWAMKKGVHFWGRGLSGGFLCSWLKKGARFPEVPCQIFT